MPRHFAASPADVAAANTFVGLGRRQPQWMTASTAVGPTPRPKRPLDSQHQSPVSSRTQNAPQPQPPTAGPAPNVLPSPTPSDEPSPSTVVPLHSPNRDLSSPDAAHSMEQEAPVPEAGTSLSVTESGCSYQSPAPSVEGRVPSVHHGAPGMPSPVLSVNVSEYQSPPVPARAPGPLASPLSGSFAIPGATLPSNGPAYNATAPVAPSSPQQSPQVQPGTIAVPAPKRRRIESFLSTGSDPTGQSGSPTGARTSGINEQPTPDAMVRAIQNHVARLGGQANIGQSLDRSRLALLQEACARSDFVFIHMHQAFCAWTLGNMGPLATACGIRDTVDRAFTVIQRVLRENQNLAPVNLQFFASFPGPLTATMNKPLVIFLRQMALNWDGLVHSTFMQLRPILASEMISILGCQSLTMQKLLFTASRRSLGVQDGPLGQTIDRIFEQDQQQANAATDLKPGGAVSDSRLLEARNPDIAMQYRNCVTAARCMSQTPENGLAPGTPTHNAPGANPGQFPQTPVNSNTLAQHTSMPLAPPPAQGQGHENGPAQQVSARGITRRISNHSAPLASAHLTGQVQPNQMRGPLSAGAATSQRNGVQYPSTLIPGYAGSLPSYITGQTTQPQPPAQQYGAAVQYQGPLRHPHNHYPQVVQDGRRQSFPIANPIVPGNANFQAGPQITTFPGNTPPAPRAQWESGNHYAPGPARANTAHPQLPSGRLSHITPLPLLPPKGKVISRLEYAHDQYYDGSLQMSLHQIHLRSPVRTSRVLGRHRDPRAQEPYYQFVRGFAASPVLIGTDSQYLTELSFEVDDATLSLLSKPLEQQDGIPEVPVYEYFEGSLRLRLRCCKMSKPQDPSTMSQSEWVTTDTTWPPHIFIILNDRSVITPKRKPHYGKDLPTELTPYVLGGSNKLNVAIATAAPSTATRVEHYALAVEIIETRSHSYIWNRILSEQVIPPEKTMEAIRKRLGTQTVCEDNDDDGVAVATQDFSIDLRDPFSAIIFRTPVRGVACTHMECFDLGNWLETRGRKPSPRECVSHRVGACGPTCRWRIYEPTLVDKWRCPICLGDARPNSLVVDGFLAEVRRNLESRGRLNARGLLVGADGSWKPVPDLDEADDDTGSDGDGAEKGPSSAGGLRRSKSKSSAPAGGGTVDGSKSRPPPEIIDLT